MSPQAPMIERIDANQTWVTDDGTDISYYVLKIVHPQLLYFIDCKVDHLNLRAILTCLRDLLNDKDSPLKLKKNQYQQIHLLLKFTMRSMRKTYF